MLNADISLQSRWLWATFIASSRERLLDFRSCWIVFIHVVRERPGGLLQFSKGKQLWSYWHLLILNVTMSCISALQETDCSTQHVCIMFRVLRRRCQPSSTTSCLTVINRRSQVTILLNYTFFTNESDLRLLAGRWRPDLFPGWWHNTYKPGFSVF